MEEERLETSAVNFNNDDETGDFDEKSDDILTIRLNTGPKLV